ncbi:MAG: phosphate ABC transporter permease subunit PstC [Opitutales bacterium]|jgi:phosphate transport system permease protein
MSKNRSSDDGGKPAGTKKGMGGSFRSSRLRFMGLDSDDVVRAFFGGNATLAIVVLVLIMFFLFREGAGFMGQNATELVTYRQSGLEYVDYMRAEVDTFHELPRFLTDVESARIKALMADGMDLKAAREQAKSLHELTAGLRKIVRPLDRFVDGLSDYAIRMRDEYKTGLNKAEERANFLGDAEKARSRGNADKAASLEASGADVKVVGVDFVQKRRYLLSMQPEYLRLNEDLRAGITAMLDTLPYDDPVIGRKMTRLREKAASFIAYTHQTEARLANWNADKPVPFLYRITDFLFGRRWITNSFFQDWYGVLPLLYGSVLVSVIALLFAVPLGVAGAIYVNQFSCPQEQKFIKPYIEFISAIPSVVIGFFGVIVWGQFVREASGWSIFSWIPGFPIAERLNAFTAGSLLALMAIPTIFTLAEDALNNVPKAYKEASLAVGATRLQTTIRVVVPTALSGIVSAVLLGFGRVIGETMVVLLCAGNRIAMPDISEGLSAIFQPVHTMTGIVAQEMGEVVPGSIHYRALFLVGTLLFFISLLINYLAQKIMRRYSIAEK